MRFARGNNIKALRASFSQEKRYIRTACIPLLLYERWSMVKCEKGEFE